MVYLASGHDSADGNGVCDLVGVAVCEEEVVE